MNNIREKVKEMKVELKLIEENYTEQMDNLKKDCIDKEVRHKSFGNGKIISQDDAFIQIQFENNIIKKFKIPDAFINKFLIAEEELKTYIDKIESLKKEIEKLNKNINVLREMVKEKTIPVEHISCKEARMCIDKGNISYEDDIEFRTIRDVSDLFNKHYEGFQRSWIKIDNDWKRVVGCFQMTPASDRNIYKNILTDDSNIFYYLIKEESDAKKEEAINGIINHEMKITYLFLKFPDAGGYKFIGVFEKDIEAMKKSIENKEYKVVYKRIGNELDLTQFFEV